MNKTERAKSLALKRVNPGFAPWARRFIRAMAWLAEHEPDTALTPAQKWGLDSTVYRYRRQLAGAEAFEIPTEPPVRADYIQAHEQRVERRRELREEREGPRPEQESLF